MGMKRFYLPLFAAVALFSASLLAGFAAASGSSQVPPQLAVSGPYRPRAVRSTSRLATRGSDSSSAKTVPNSPHMTGCRSAGTRSPSTAAASAPERAPTNGHGPAAGSRSFKYRAHRTPVHGNPY
jgi:hypothetical protein